jgi:hypothetical protein
MRMHWQWGNEPRIPMEIGMKKALIAGVAAAAVLAGGQAIAQTTTIEISPDQRTKIKEYVVKERVKPVTVKERLTVGATVPQDVELVAVPETWGVPATRNYRYFYSDNRVVLVEPSSRRVIQVVD